MSEEVIGYATLQFHRGGLFDGEPVGDEIHLVRRTKMGTPGPTLCGRARFKEDAGPFAGFVAVMYAGDGWSVGGGISGPSWTFKACADCVVVADIALPVWGSTHGKLFANPAAER